MSYTASLNKQIWLLMGIDFLLETSRNTQSKQILSFLYYTKSEQPAEYNVLQVHSNIGMNDQFVTATCRPVTFD